MKAFTTTTFGKWILAGEHAVLRGCPALAFPLTSCSLQLSYTPSESEFDVEFSGSHGEDLKLLFYGVIENALSQLQRHTPLRGNFKVHSSLPVGTGLGASAAICGAVGRWCEAQGWLQNGVYEFSRRLENLFHGESSGVDLAVSLSGEGVRFVRGGERAVFTPKWWPRLYLSYCGQRGITSECVNKVKRGFEANPERARALDAQMFEAVSKAERALLLDKDEGLPLLRAALDQARDCFMGWDLCAGDLGAHLDRLMEAGALAVKPTGSGGGGFALSLWEKNPPPALVPLLVSVPQPKTPL